MEINLPYLILTLGISPFHFPYGSMICTKRLHNDRPKCGGMLANPRAYQIHAEIRLFVPGLHHTYLKENFKKFVSVDSPRSPLSNEIWKPDLLQEVTEWETKLLRHLFEAEGNDSSGVM